MKQLTLTLSSLLETFVHDHFLSSRWVDSHLCLEEVQDFFKEQMEQIWLVLTKILWSNVNWSEVHWNQTLIYLSMIRHKIVLIKSQTNDLFELLHMFIYDQFYKF